MILKKVFKNNWKKLSLTYILFNIENILSLFKPYFLGNSIDETIRGNKNGIIMFIGLYCFLVIVGSFRRINDTRTFAKIYSTLAVEIVEAQHMKNITPSKITARVSLSNKLVDFFETDITIFFQTVYNIFGALIMLSIYKEALLFYCLSIVIPIAIINKIYSKKNMKLLTLYNNQLEKAVDSISSKNKDLVKNHYETITKLRVRISDNEALNFLSNEVFIIFLIGSSLFVFYGNKLVSVGAVVAVFQYVNMFILGLDDIPYLVEQVNKIKDIQKRIFEN